MKYTIILLSFTLLSGCQILTLSFSDEDLSYIKWIKQGSKYVFVSAEKDTIIYEISSISDYRNNSNNPIEVGGTFISAPTERIVKCKKQTKEVIEEFNFIYLTKYSNSPANISVHFEDVDFGFNDKEFNKSYLLMDKTINDIYYFEDYQSNNANSSNEKTNVNKIWWSKSLGLLKYQTSDSLVWKRINY